MAKEENETQFIDLCILFQTRRLQEFDSCFPRIMHCFDRIKKGEALEEEEKLSLREYAVMRSIAALKSYVHHLERHHLSELRDKVSTCHRIVVHFEQKKGGYSLSVGMFIPSEKKESTFDKAALMDLYHSLSQLVSFTLDRPLPDQTHKPRKD